jgi:hypothetical protein
MGLQRNDIFNPPARARDIRLTPAKLDVLDFMQDYDVIPSTYVKAQFSPDYARNILAEFIPAKLVQIPDGYEHIDARNRIRPLQLTELALKKLSDAGRLRRRVPMNDHFKHAYLRSVIAHSFAQAPKEIPQLTLHDEAELLNRNRPDPQPVPDNASWFEINGHTVRPDHPAFGFTYTLGQHTASMWFHGFEADRASERVKSDTYEKKTIAKSFDQYAEYLRRRLYTRFDTILPFFPIITIGEGRMSTMLDALKSIVPEETIRKRFLFKALPNFLAYAPLPPPTAHMVTEPWQRTDGDFSLIDTLKSVATSKQRAR